MTERMAPRTTEFEWAERTAGDLLAPLETRWRHTLRVVERADAFECVLPPGEFEVLAAAGYLHDVGYAPELVETGFHPLDGARFVRRAGHERLARLVAHHSASDAEAEERGVTAALAEFPEEDSLVARALTYCDLTTGPGGDELELSVRLSEMAARLGEDDPAVDPLLTM